MRGEGRVRARPSLTAPGVDAMFPDAAFFKEFAIRLPKAATDVRDAMVDRGYLAGVPAPGWSTG